MSDFNFLGNFLGKKANLSRDGHDMSAQHAYSMPFGTLNVVDCLFTVPGEHYKCNYSGYVQTAPMREDNFATIYNNLKAVFVPYSSLQRNYLSKVLSTPQHKEDALFRDLFTADFVLDLQSVAFWLFPSYIVSKLFEGLFQIPNISEFYFDLDVEKFARTYVVNNETHKEFLDDIASNFVAFKIFMYSISPSAWREMRNGTSFVELIDGLSYVMRSQSGNFMCYDALRLLDMLGYGNFLPNFESAFKKLVDAILNDTLESVNPYFGIDPVFQVMAFNDILSRFIFTTFPSITFNANALFAYQFYFQMVESSNYRQPDNLSIFTLDSVLTDINSDLSHYPVFDTSNTSVVFRSFVFSEFNSADSQLYFTNFGPNDFLFGDREYPAMLLSFLFCEHNPLLFADVFTTAQNTVVAGNIPSMVTSTFNQNPVLQIAEKSALYKLREDILRAGVRVDKQMESVYGVSGDNNLVDSIFVLDKSSVPLNITSLINQAETAEAPLGARGARGNGSGGLDFTFDSRDYGFILIIQSFTCEAFYESFMCDPVLKKGLSSFWNPHFNNLGLEPVYNYDCSMISKSSEDGDIVSANNATLGYTARYFELKQRVNKVHGAFTNFGFAVNPLLLDDDTVGSKRYIPASLIRGNSVYGGFVPTLIDQQVHHFNTSSRLRFNPFMVNNLFVSMYDGGAFGSAAYDHFRCIMNCQVHKVSPMPKLGLIRV